jgi:hypothetical protein
LQELPLEQLPCMNRTQGRAHPSGCIQDPSLIAAASTSSSCPPPPCGPAQRHPNWRPPRCPTPTAGTAWSWLPSAWEVLENVGASRQEVTDVAAPIGFLTQQLDDEQAKRGKRAGGWDARQAVARPSWASAWAALSREAVSAAGTLAQRLEAPPVSWQGRLSADFFSGAQLKVGKSRWRGGGRRGSG